MAMHSDRYSFLKFVRYQDVFLWDIKRYFATQVLSTFPVVRLGDYINEESAKYSISDSTKTYGILGVNNQMGIFDAYTENGAKIKQKYKKMEEGWIAYNPYRVNVGSVGVKRQSHMNDYISPAYVVFSCKKGLLPDFLYLMMKTPTFNRIIRKNTTGSVRQSLSFKNLRALKIPMPSLEEQERLLSAYNHCFGKAESISSLIETTQLTWEQNVCKLLFVEHKVEEEKTGNAFLRFIHYKDITEWGITMIKKKKGHGYSSLYEIAKIKELCKVNSGGTPNRSNKAYYKGNIPWVKTGEVLNDIIYETEEHISEEAIANSSAKLYPKGSLIIAMYGQGDTRGRSAKLGIEATTNQACAVLHQIDNGKVLTDYLWAYIQVMYNDLRSLASGTNQPNLNADKIKNYGVPVPPKEVQEEIVAYTKEKREQISSLRAEAQRLKQQALQDFEKELFK